CGRGLVHPAARTAALGARHPLRTRGRRGADAVRAHRWSTQDPGRDRQGLRRDPRADPSDRIENDVETAPPLQVTGPARLPRLVDWHDELLYSRRIVRHDRRGRPKIWAAPSSWNGLILLEEAR